MSLCSLVEQTVGSGLQHVVISFLSDGALRSRLERAGATVIELAGRRGGAGAFVLPGLVANIQRAKPDIVQSWMYHANLAGTVVRGLGYFKPPLIWSIRQSLDNRSLDPFSTRAVIWLGGRLSASPGAVVYNSVNAARTHEAIGYAASRRRIIHNGIDCDRFRPQPEIRYSLRAQLGLDPDTLLIGRIGRYSPMKGFDTLLRAFRKLLDVLPSARLLLVGTGIGPGNRELISLCSRYGCLDYIHMMGPRLDIEKVYPALDIVVSPSIGNEGFPNVVAEALASGALVVSTAVGDGSPLDRGVHRIVPARDDEALSKAIFSLTTLPLEERRRLSESGRQFVENNFSMEAFAEQHIRLYEELSATALAKRRY
jgi:glycosyltransferase involved in cell wall biosynthesis